MVSNVLVLQPAGCVVYVTTLRIVDFESHYLSSCKQLNFPLPIAIITKIFLP